MSDCRRYCTAHKAIAYPVDSRLLDIARGQFVKAAKDVSIEMKHTFVREGGHYGARLEAQRKLPKALPDSQHLMGWLETAMQRARTLRNQTPKGKWQALCDARSRGRVYLQG